MVGRQLRVAARIWDTKAELLRFKFIRPVTTNEDVVASASHWIQSGSICRCCTALPEDHDESSYAYRRCLIDDDFVVVACHYLTVTNDVDLNVVAPSVLGGFDPTVR